ncbi:MAG: hypothetical protein BJ554DRAFT_7380 [Olpidium bornovanus]|uniref:Carbohydrate kinase FGGY N-terminal domain-containing protein n=1 Tax=Olpidium bornovanus TaxID=278681 RepID=A0A8H7ZW65_9FUNG|nr:MAG: hypothetical protein BJ554DRAFT_7380 [Olpidium bornovanus]
MLAARRDCAAHRVLPPRAPPLVPPATPRGSASFRRAPSRPRAGGTRAAFEAASVPAAARPRAARADLARPPFLFLRPFRAAAAAATATGRTGRLSRGGGPRRFHAPAAIGGAMPPYVASIDQGTSSSKFVVYDRNGVCVAHHQEEFDQLYPRAGCVEEVAGLATQTRARHFRRSPVGILQSLRRCHVHKGARSPRSCDLQVG